MKSLGKILLIAVFVVPIVVCILALKSIWSDDDKLTKKTPTNSAPVTIGKTVVVSGDEEISGESSTAATSGETFQMGNDTFVTNIGDPISKMYTDAQISAALTNVYLEANENSEVVGKLERRTAVVAQKFPEGWSRVSEKEGSNLSGWVKTANISFPTDAGNLNTNPSSSTGTVSADAGLNLRMNPTLDATVLTVIPDKTSITILETANGWHKVTYNGLTGWVNAQYVK